MADSAARELIYIFIHRTLFTVYSVGTVCQFKISTKEESKWVKRGYYYQCYRTLIVIMLAAILEAHHVQSKPKQTTRKTVNHIRQRTVGEDFCYNHSAFNFELTPLWFFICSFTKRLYAVIRRAFACSVVFAVKGLVLRFLVWQGLLLVLLDEVVRPRLLLFDVDLVRVLDDLFPLLVVRPRLRLLDLVRVLDDLFPLLVVRVLDDLFPLLVDVLDAERERCLVFDAGLDQDKQQRIGQELGTVDYGGYE
jgi:hypothetical protein